MPKSFYILSLILLSVVLFSCNNRKKLILGTWHVVKWDNPTADSFFTKTKDYIDTIGRGHTDAENIEIYGTANMDSMRDLLRKQYDSAKAANEQVQNTTIFNFKKGGDFDITINGTTNTGKWLLDNDNGLIIEEKGFSNSQDLSKYEIIDLTDKQLVLRFYEDNVSNTVTFEHGPK